jgi:hypothetical protein
MDWKKEWLGAADFSPTLLATYVSKSQLVMHCIGKNSENFGEIQ